MDDKKTSEESLGQETPKDVSQNQDKKNVYKTCPIGSINEILAESLSTLSDEIPLGKPPDP